MRNQLLIEKLECNGKIIQLSNLSEFITSNYDLINEFKETYGYNISKAKMKIGQVVVSLKWLEPRDKMDISTCIETFKMLSLLFENLQQSTPQLVIIFS